ncbi:hypothetical protein [Micromonospora sp. KC213]|uniref:hypothetical protein n=1 Tax=Micromonospora sp. KC213 TaxID=2530378 RepID=UPI00104CFCED|nr:hypothetical protein [Micromonospora sp. KC213]TDC43468.1 hypothetical protein E1166_03320 [Micromonospora sp. KC213]
MVSRFTVRRVLAAVLAAITGLTVAQAPAAAVSLTENIGTQAIIGTDGRYPVDPAAYPATATVLLTFSYYDHDGQWKAGRCTGWVSGHHDRSTTIITAGHCVYGAETGIWHSNYHVHVGGPNAIICPARVLYKAARWGVPPVPEYDYGAVKVDCRPSGQPLGQLTGAYGYSTNYIFAGTAVRTQGFPNDKQSTPWLQWAADGVVGPSTAQRLSYDNDTFFGQNGSPVYVPAVPGCGPCVTAIHGYHPGPNLNFNYGVRITTEVHRDIRNWTSL